MPAMQWTEPAGGAYRRTAGKRLSGAGKANGYRVLQFNAVVASNIHAFHLYQRLGFVDLGIIPGGFLNKDGVYEDIHVMYHNLVED